MQRLYFSVYGIPLHLDVNRVLLFIVIVIQYYLLPRGKLQAFSADKRDKNLILFQVSQ